MSVMRDKNWTQDSLIQNKTKCTLNSCFVATRAKRHFSQYLAKSSGLIYLAIFVSSSVVCVFNLSVV